MGDQAESHSRPVVLITGFGPFGEHKVNASWVSIKHINVQQLEEKNNISLIQMEVPVLYRTVDEVIPTLWKKYNPILVIHVGVSARATEMTLESVAHGTDYTRLDCDSLCPSKTSPQEESSVIHCKMDVVKLSEKYNKRNNVISACVSTNAGRFNNRNKQNRTLDEIKIQSKNSRLRAKMDISSFMASSMRRNGGSKRPPSLQKK